MRFTFRRSERLRSAKTIQALYKSPDQGYNYPFRYSFAPSHAPLSGAPAEILIAVSRRRFPKAVDRNLIRRRIREAYRLNRSLLTPAESESRVPLSLIITYIGTGIESYQVIERKLVLLLREIATRHADAGGIAVKDKQ
jgi:ribonuclease P protein component